MSLRVPFGLRESTLYEPNGVPNGKACGCICPSCKRPLVAKQRASTPHFAHAPGEDCAKGFETAVHLAAKQIIAERKEVRLPAVEYRSTLQYAPSKVHTAETLLCLDEVELEVWMGSIRPDIWVRAGDERYLVEIAVTHFVDEVKTSKIREIRIPALEIDLQSFKDNFTFAALEKLLFNAPYTAKWIFNQHIEDMAAEAVQIYELTEHAQEDMFHIGMAEAMQLHELAKQREEKLAELARPNNALARKNEESQRAKAEGEKSEKFHRYRVLPPNEKLERNICELGISHAQMKKFSAFIPWGDSFGVPQDVWQSAVLVYIAKNEQRGYLSYDVQFQECLAWMRRAFNVHAPVPDGDSVATWKYLKHLESLGILKYLWNKKFALKIKSRNWPQMFPQTF